MSNQGIEQNASRWTDLRGHARLLMPNLLDGLKNRGRRVVRREEGGPAYISVREVAMLGLVSELAGDCYFSISAVQLEGRLLSIPFLFHEWGSSRSPHTRLGVLRVNAVTTFDADDREQVDAYQLLDISFDARTGILTVVGEPGASIHAGVDAIDVEVEVFAAAGPPMRQLRGLMGMTVGGPPDMDGVVWIR